jgi:hypothetical protein
MASKQSSSQTVAGLVFVGTFMSGMGIGMLYGNTRTGVILGLGAGFLLMAAVTAYYRSKENN